MQTNINSNKRGFTIVELLIVIVVIAILAAISIVAYNGIQNRGKTSAGAALAGQIVKKAEAYNTIQSSYPTAAELIGNYDKGTTTASTKTQEAKLDDATAVISLTAAATGTTYSTTLSDGNKKVAVFGCAAGLNVYYYDYTPSTAAMQTVKAGAGC